MPLVPVPPPEPSASVWLVSDLRDTGALSSRLAPSPCIGTTLSGPVAPAALVVGAATGARARRFRTVEPVPPPAPSASVRLVSDLRDTGAFSSRLAPSPCIGTTRPELVAPAALVVGAATGARTRPFRTEERLPVDPVPPLDPSASVALVSDLHKAGASRSRLRLASSLRTARC